MYWRLLIRQQRFTFTHFAMDDVMESNSLSLAYDTFIANGVRRIFSKNIRMEKTRLIWFTLHHTATTSEACEFHAKQNKPSASLVWMLEITEIKNTLRTRNALKSNVF